MSTTALCTFYKGIIEFHHHLVQELLCFGPQVDWTSGKDSGAHQSASERITARHPPACEPFSTYTASEKCRKTIRDPNHPSQSQPLFTAAVRQTPPEHPHSHHQTQIGRFFFSFFCFVSQYLRLLGVACLPCFKHFIAAVNTVHMTNIFLKSVDGCWGQEGVKEEKDM